MLYRITDEEHPRFDQIGNYDRRWIIPSSKPELYCHTIKFIDGHTEQFLGYQIEKLERVFEVMHNDNTLSRLTVTPTRVTLKIKPGEEAEEERYTVIAKRIAEQVDYPLSLRGTFSPDLEYIFMRTKDKKPPVVFLFDKVTGDSVEKK